MSLQVFQLTFLLQQNTCRPGRDWNTLSEIGACPAGSQPPPTFIGCSTSSNMFSDFDNMANSVYGLSAVLKDESYRCTELENRLKNGTLTPGDICGSNASSTDFREILNSNTYLIRLFTCSSGSSSNQNPYAGCFPVKRSVR
jgi:hypothetical protein